MTEEMKWVPDNDMRGSSLRYEGYLFFSFFLKSPHQSRAAKTWLAQGYNCRVDRNSKNHTLRTSLLLLYCLLPPTKGDFNYTFLVMMVKKNPGQASTE